MYLVDSGCRKVLSFDYNEITGSVKNQSVVVDYNNFKDIEDLGIPDGLAVDVEGKLWVAGCYSGRIHCWDPETAEKLAFVEIPARCVSSCCFGGPDYKSLFVTSFTLGSDVEDMINRYHRPGALFSVQGLGVCGQPPNKFKSARN